MTSILEHDDAIALMEQATLSPQQVADCQQHLQAFLQRYLPCFQRAEQRRNATVIVQGKLSDLQRKTSEPIAYQAGLQRKPLQAFVGWAPWDDEAVMAQLRSHVREAWPDANAVFVLDGSAFPKKGKRLLRSRTPVVWAFGQSGQLPGRHLPDVLLPLRPHRLGPPVVPAQGVGRRPCPTGGLSHPPGHRLPGALANRARPDRA